MSRIARVVIEKIPHHLTQRGNGRQRVFFRDTDYRLYLDLLRDHAQAHGLVIWGYCLMPNHVHLLAVPETASSVGRALGRAHAQYAQHYNLSHRSCGHVWQARFFSCPLDGAHLWRSLAYIERNPVRAGIVEEASDYPWSSAAAHAGFAAPEDFLHMDAWRTEYTAARWQTVLRASVDEEALGERLRDATRRGRPLGGEEFVEQLERKAGRHLRPLPAGRPKKAEAARTGIGI